MMFNPMPPKTPMKEPVQTPVRVVPSLIGDADLVGCWLFYTGGGDKVYDFSGKGNHGTRKTSGTAYPSWRDGPYGWTLDFPGDEGYVEVPNDPSIVPGTSNCSVLVWHYSKYPQSYDYARIFSFGTPGGPFVDVRYDPQPGDLRVIYQDSAGDLADSRPADVATRGQWNLEVFPTTVRRCMYT